MENNLGTENISAVYLRKGSGRTGASGYAAPTEY